VRLPAPVLCRAAAALALVVSTAALARAAGWRQVPPYAAGFPHLFPRTTDIRPREGALVGADLDHDGSAELIASVPSGVLTVIGRNGGARAGWPRLFGALPQPAWPAGRPGIGDLDGDGLDEIVTCVTAGAPTRRRFLVALHADGADVPGWPVELRATGTGGGCSPGASVVADLDGDGYSEVVRAEGAAVFAFDGFGRSVPGWPWQAPPDAAGRVRPINADPIAADLDGDGRPEIVVIESGYEPRLYAVDAGGRTVAHFPVPLGQVVDRQAPAAADIDGDGHAEIIQATLPFDGDGAAATGARPAARGRVVPGIESTGPGPTVPASLHVLRFDGAAAPGWPLTLGGGAVYGAMVADLEGLGRLSILQGDGDQLDGYDAEGRTLRGFPLVLRGLPRGAEARFDTPWSAADLDGDGGIDLLRVSGFVEAGAAALRVIGLHVPAGPARGYPFTVTGILPSSPVVATDLTGDGVPEVVILASEGTNGGWRLLAWNVAAGKGP
jgi:hypothetical protein